MLGDVFLEQQVDGDLLSECEEEDFIKEDYPNASSQHWKQFWYA